MANVFWRKYSQQIGNCKVEQHNPSIHFFATDPGSGRGDSNLNREATLRVATTRRSFYLALPGGGTQASQWTWLLGLLQGLLPEGCSLNTSPGSHLGCIYN